MKITLAQFIAFSSKTGTPAKLKAVKEIKNKEYSIFTDYWKPVRDELHKILEGRSTFDRLDQIALQASTDRGMRPNYTAAARKLRHFFQNLDYSYQSAPSAVWSSPDELLTVNTTPEFVLTMNGKTYLMKINYRVKKENEHLTKNNTASTLLMMEHGKYSIRPDNSIPAVLNLQNGKLITLDSLRNPTLETLNADAVMFEALWGMA